MGNNVFFIFFLNYYLTPEYWKEAHDKYTTTGTLPEDFVKERKAAVSGYRTWEEAYPGVSYDPRDSFYNSKTGQFSYTDHENRVVSGVYDGTKGTFTFTNENGELVQGTNEGEVNKYTGDYGQWTFDESSGSWKGAGGETYIPPSVYNPVTGTYDYHPSTGEHSSVDGYTYQWGSKGLSGGIYTGPGSTWTAPEGWTQSSDGTWTSSGGTTSGTTTDSGGHTAPSGDSGGYTAPSGDSGGMTGHAIYDSSLTRSWLSKWLWGFTRKMLCCMIKAN